MGSRSTIFHVDTIRETFGDDIISQLQGKSTVPHDIIRAKFSLPSMLVKALFQVVAFIHRIHSQPQDRISRQAFEAS